MCVLGWVCSLWWWMSVTHPLVLVSALLTETHKWQHLWITAEYFSVWEESSDIGLAAGISLVTENQRRVLRCSEVFQTARYLGLRCVHATDLYNDGMPLGSEATRHVRVAILLFPPVRRHHWPKITWFKAYQSHRISFLKMWQVCAVAY